MAQPLEYRRRAAILPHAQSGRKDGLESEEMNKLKYAFDFDIQISIRDTESVLWVNWPWTRGHFP